MLRRNRLLEPLSAHAATEPALATTPEFAALQGALGKVNDVKASKLFLGPAEQEIFLQRTTYTVLSEPTDIHRY